MLIPMRKILLPYLFSPKELNELDKVGIFGIDDNGGGDGVSKLV